MSTVNYILDTLKVVFQNEEEKVISDYRNNKVKLVGIKFDSKNNFTSTTDENTYLNKNNVLIVYNENFVQFMDKNNYRPGGGNGALRKYRSDGSLERISDAFVYGVPTGKIPEKHNMYDNMPESTYTYKKIIDRSIENIIEAVKNKNIDYILWSVNGDGHLGLGIFGKYRNSQKIAEYITKRLKSVFTNHYYYPEKKNGNNVQDHGEPIDLPEELGLNDDDDDGMGKNKKTYNTLLEWVREDDPSPLSREEADKLGMQFENFYLNKGCVGGFWFPIKDIAKENKIPEVSIRGEIKNKDFYYPSYDEIRFANNNFSVLFKENGIWRWIHTYLKKVMKGCDDKPLQLTQPISNCNLREHLESDYPFKRNASLEIMYELPDSKGYKRQHTTMFIIHFNLDHPSIKQNKLIVGNGGVCNIKDSFRKAIYDNFKKTIKDKLILEPKQNIEKYGKSMAQIYKPNNSELMEDFKIGILNYIKEKIGLTSKTKQIKNFVNTFFYFCTIDKNPLYSIKNIFFDFKYWFLYRKLKNQNPLYYYELPSEFKNKLVINDEKKLNLKLLCKS